MKKPTRKLKAFYVVSGTTADGNTEQVETFSHKGQILKGLRKQGLDFDRYQSITIRKQPIQHYPTACHSLFTREIPTITGNIQGGIYA